MRWSGHGLCTAVLAGLVFSAANADAQDSPARAPEPGQVGAPSLLTSPGIRVEATSDAPHAVLARIDFLGSGGPRNLGFYEVARVCNLPCAAVLPRDGSSYRIVGPGLTPSSPFVLPEGPSDVDVHVRTGSWRLYATGLTFSVLGMAYVPTGAGLLAGRAALGSSPNAGVLTPIGGAFLSVGVAALAIGLPLWLSNRSHLDLQPRANATASSLGFGPGGLTF